jgi:hypothetical protein
MNTLLNEKLMVEQRMNEEISDDDINVMLKAQYDILKYYDYDFDCCDTGLIFYKNEPVNVILSEVENPINNIRFLCKLRDCF